MLTSSVWPSRKVSGRNLRPFGRVSATRWIAWGQTFAIGGTSVFVRRCSAGDAAVLAVPDACVPVSSARPPSVAPPMAMATAAAAIATRG